MFCFLFVFVFFLGGGGEASLCSVLRKGLIVFLIKLLVITLHLKIENERTSVAFDDIICLLTPWNTRLSNQTNIMLHFQDLLK